MRIMMRMQWDGITPDQYETIRKDVNWEGDVPHGAVLHVAGFANNALFVTDIWESEEDYNNFVNSRLMPGVQKLGVTSQPTVQIIPVHAIFNPGLK